MSENNFPELKQLLSLPLSKAVRLGTVQFFHFGKTHITNAYGLVLDVGIWTLEAACYWSLQQNGQEVISYQEADVPRDTASFADPSFELLLPGNTLRDRKLHELIREAEGELNVWQVTASPQGDLSFSMPGNRVLDIRPTEGVLPDTNLFWRLFNNVSGEKIGFGPDGIVRE